jgi:tetratricopeptide (TPR) repeat protein
MSFKAAKCPQCAGALQVPDDRDFIKCMYCGVDIAVRQAISLVDANEQNYKSLGEVAYDAQNYEEAYQYFSRALESNPNDAWLWEKKGTCAGMLSSLTTSRLGEMTTLHKKALECANNDAEADVLRMMCAMSEVSVCRAFFNASLDHFIAFVGVPSAKFEYLDRCIEMISVCEHADALDPKNPFTADLIVDISKRCKELTGLSQEEKQFFTQKYNNYLFKLNELKATQGDEVAKADNAKVTAEQARASEKPSFSIGDGIRLMIGLPVFALICWIGWTFLSAAFRAVFSK